MLRYRLISGSLMGATVLLAFFYLPAAGHLALLMVIAALGQWEFYRLMNAGDFPVFRYVGIACGGVLLASTFGWLLGGGGLPGLGAEIERFVLTASLIVVFLRQFPQKHNPKPLQTMACTLFGVWYVAYLLNFVTRLAFTWDAGGVLDPIAPTGRRLVIYLVLVVKFTDIGAYTAGRLLGRHPFFPRISPKKTWEGVLGGVATAVAVSLVFLRVSGGVLAMNTLHAVVLGLLLAVAGILGDLFESLIKRAVSVKDSSAVVPGMGGVLDVIDSLLFGAPVLYVYARVLMS